MKTTYTGTLFFDDLSEAEVTLYLYDAVKWNKEAKRIGKLEFNGIKSWTIIDREDAAELEKTLGDEIGIDEYHEYLEIELLNGSKQFFKNSYVSLFVM